MSAWQENTAMLNSSMGMFDYYKPDFPKHCPKCFERFSDWQGKDGPCGLYIWEQHELAPIDQPIDKDARISLKERDVKRLPEVFDFETKCENCKIWVKAEGLCIDGVWRYTFIREPGVPYPSGEEHELYRLNLYVQDIAKRTGKEVVVYEEDGLGIFRAINLNTNFGASICLKQSDHLVDQKTFGEKAHKGPVVYVDGYDAIKFGYERMYWGALHALGLSEASIEFTYPNPDEWVDDIRKQVEQKWRYIDNKTD